MGGKMKRLSYFLYEFSSYSFNMSVIRDKGKEWVKTFSFDKYMLQK